MTQATCGGISVESLGMSRKNFRQPNRLVGPIAQLFCVVLFFIAGGPLYAEEPPKLWKFGGDAQPIDHVLQSHNGPKITRQEHALQKGKKKELSKKQVLRTNKQGDSLQLPIPPDPHRSRGTGKSKLKLKKERPRTSAPSVRAAGVLQQNRATSRTDRLEEGSTTLGDAHLLLMGTGSEIRFRGIGREKTQQAHPIPVLELPSDKPKLVVKKISHTIEEHAAPVDEEHAVPVEVPVVELDHEIVAIDFLRSALPLTFGEKDNAMPKAPRINKARRPKKIQGLFGYSR